jgi:hypothetical protein
MLVAEQPITSDWIKSDQSLSKHLTITRHRVLLSSLVSDIALRTGVDMRCDENDVSSGITVSIHWPNRSLAELMEALQALTSTKLGAWVWQKSSADGKNTYRFSRTPHAKDRGKQVAGLAQQALERHVQLMAEFAEMAPDQRKQQKSRLMENLGINDSEADYMIMEEGFWNVTSLFNAAFPGEQGLSILRGESEPTLVTDDAPPQVKHFLSAVWSKLGLKRRTPDGSFVEVPAPTRLRFYRLPTDSSDAHIVPKIMIDTGNGSGVSCFGSGYLDSAFRKEIVKAWLLNGDSLTSPSQGSTVDLTGVPEYKYPLRFGSTLDRDIMEAVRGTGTPCILLVPLQHLATVRNPQGEKLGSYLEKLGTRPTGPLMAKWRNDVLLVNHLRWFVEEDVAVPAGLINAHLQNADGMVTLQGIAKLAGRLTPKQFSNLSVTFPDMLLFVELFPILRIADKFPLMLSTAGQAVTPELVRNIRPIESVAALPWLIDGSAAFVRLTSKDSVGRDGRRARTITLEYRGQSPSWKEAKQILQVEPLKPAEAPKQ